MYTVIKNFVSYVFICLSVVQLAGCLGNNSPQVTSSPKSNFVVVNVLDKEVFDDCHIVGSINVAYDDIENYAQHNWDKNTTQVVMQCSTHRCSSSLEAAKILINLGFKPENVWAYEGGTALARHEGIQTTGPAQEGYLQDIPVQENKATQQDGIQLMSTQQLKDFLAKLPK